MRGSPRRAAGELETAVLTVLWAACPTRAGAAGSDGEAEVWLIPAEVQAELSRGGDTLAYSSVMTTLARLHTKGLAERRARGRGWEYRPADQAVDHAAARMRALLGAGPAPALVLSRFVAGLRHEDEAVLHQLLDEAPPADHGDQ